MVEIEAKHLRRVHRRGTREVVALDDVSLTVTAGADITIVGSSGSGKSTLLQLLGLIDRPTSGTVRLDGTDTGAMTDDERSLVRRRTFGFVFQSFLLLPGLSAWENVALAELLEGHRLRAHRDRALSLLDEVGLADRSDHAPHELSGGEQQRVAVARALMADPAVVFADEPTGALDQATSSRMVRLLRSLTVERGRSLVMVTHEEHLAVRSDTRVVRLTDGRVATASAAVR